MQTSVLLQPKKSFEEFQQWLQAAPIRQRMLIENVTMREAGSLNKQQVLTTGSSKMRLSVKDIYESWYLLRWIG